MTDAASDRVAASLRTALLSGEHPPGTWIRQDEVARRLGASRLPVREALRILEAEGLVEHHPRRGARVPMLTAVEVQVVYRMRERLEPLALSLSLPHLGPATLGDIRATQSEIEAGTDVERFLELDRRFHLLTYSGCEVELLMESVHRLWNITQHHRRAFVAHDRAARAGRAWAINAEHRLLIDALERADHRSAEAQLAAHIRRTRLELAVHPTLTT